MYEPWYVVVGSAVGGVLVPPVGDADESVGFVPIGSVRIRSSRVKLRFGRLDPSAVPAVNTMVYVPAARRTSPLTDCPAGVNNVYTSLPSASRIDIRIAEFTEGLADNALSAKWNNCDS